MNHLFVPYEIAEKLKALGFDEPCFAYFISPTKRVPAAYSKDDEEYPRNSDLIMNWIAAPMHQQVKDWLRTEHDIEMVVDKCAPDIGYVATVYYDLDGRLREKSLAGHNEEIEVEFTYYQALNRAIEEALKLI